MSNQPTDVTQDCTISIHTGGAVLLFHKDNQVSKLPDRGTYNAQYTRDVGTYNVSLSTGGCLTVTLAGKHLSGHEVRLRILNIVDNNAGVLVEALKTEFQGYFGCPNITQEEVDTLSKAAAIFFNAQAQDTARRIMSYVK